MLHDPLGRTCKNIKNSCGKLFTRKRYEVMSEEDQHIIEFPDKDIIQEQGFIEEQEVIYENFPDQRL